MNLKEMLHKIVMSYFILVTCILVAVMVIGLVFDPDAKLSYKSLSAPLFYALLGIIPSAVMYSKKELSDKQIVVRKIIRLVITEIEIMAYFIINPAIDTSEPKRIIALMLSVLGVYVIANLINIANSCFTAQKMTKELLDFQKNAR